MPEEYYYTASEAQAVLGMSRTQFHRKVGEGTIPKYTPPGMKHSVYPKKEIDDMARAMDIILVTRERIEFSRSTPNEQEEERLIGIKCFGRDFITPLSERIAFQEKNPYTFYSLKVSDHVAGYISMFRFMPEFLDDLLTGKHIEIEITVDDVIPFSRLEDFDIYIDVLAMNPDIPRKLRKWYAGILVSQFIDTLFHFIGNGYFIRNIYTVTSRDEGDTLVNQLGFQLLEGKSLVPGRVAYRYTLDATGIRHLKRWSRRRV